MAIWPMKGHSRIICGRAMSKAMFMWSVVSICLFMKKIKTPPPQGDFRSILVFGSFKQPDISIRYKSKVLDTLIAPSLRYLLQLRN